MRDQDDENYDWEEDERKTKRFKKIEEEEEPYVSDLGEDLNSDLEAVEEEDGARVVKKTGKDRADRYILERNKSLRRETTELNAKRNIFFNHHRHLFLPFLNQGKHNYFTDVIDKIPGIQESEIVPFKMLEQQPKEITNGTMKDYQLKGLSWMVYLHDNFMNGILGDEMGLGKTLQTISLFTYLKFERNESGPFLVICPLSVLESWFSELKRWSPELKSVRFHGNQTERMRLKQQAVDLDYDVIVTTYEMVLSEVHWFTNRYTYRYVVIDEGHRIKNEQTQLGQAVMSLNTQHRLLLTGTPLQNNLKELWALLHWLYPQIFTPSTSQVFTDAFDLQKSICDQAVLDSSRKLLEVVMLRRLKSEVQLNIPPKTETTIFVPLAPMQSFWYKRLISQLDKGTLAELFKRPRTTPTEATDVDDGESDTKSAASGSVRRNNSYSTLASAEYDSEYAATYRLDEAESLLKEASSKNANDWQKMMNLLMQLRKCCDHPYLFPNSEPEPYENGEHMIVASSKFVLLDKLLPKLKAEGHRVLIFTNFTRMLDLLEDYLNYRGYGANYSRLDGMTARAKRNLDIRLFNKVDSPCFVFLLSTRAGGLGINLTGADTCIFFDSDWNPQVDIQAQARCHRIGQTKPVSVYRLITKDSVEERILARTLKKLYLSARVTEESDDVSESDPRFSRNDLISMIRSGTASLSSKADDPLEFAKMSIDEILTKSRAHAERVQKAEADGVDLEAEIFNQQDLDIRMFDGIKFTSGVQIARAWKKHNQLDPIEMVSGVRERKQRVVNVGGHMVLKDSLQTAEGEAVKTLSGTADAKAKRSREEATRQSNRKPRDWTHDEACFFCHDGGTIITCSRCPRSYHPKCVGMTSTQVKRATMWTCPQHHCMECGRNTADAGGLIYRCTTCPVGFCEDHLPPEEKIEPVGDECPELAARGYHRIKQAYWIQCDVCVDFFNNNHAKIPGEAKGPLEFKPQEENPDDFIPEDPEDAEAGKVILMDEDQEDEEDE